MKVVITHPWGERLGGAETMLWTLLRFTDPNRVQPIVAFLQGGAFEREVAALGIQTAVFPAGRMRQAASVSRVARSLATLLERQRPALLLNWMPKTQLYGAMGAALAGMTGRLVWWQHGIPSGHWIDRVATLLPARAVGCSSRSAGEAQARQWPHRPTFVVHPGIEQPTQLAPSQLQALRQRLRISQAAIVVGTVGRLQPWKGQHRLLEIVSELRQRGRNVHGLVVGGDAYGLSPDYERSLFDLAGQLQISDWITFAGQVPDPGPYLQTMDVFLSTAVGEPFGIALVEAMAQGVPVVAFDAGGPAETIGSQDCGLLVESGDQRGLVEAVDRLVHDEPARRHIGEQGRRRYRRVFTAARMTDEIWRNLEAIGHGEVSSVPA